MFPFTLICVGEQFYSSTSPPLPLPCLLYLDNSETGKAVTMEFSCIQQYFIRDIHVKYGIPNSSQSPDIGQNSDGDIFHFRISGQSFMNENFHNSKTNDNINMKLGVLSKLDKRNTVTSIRISHNQNISRNQNI